MKRGAALYRKPEASGERKLISGHNLIGADGAGGGRKCSPPGHKGEKGAGSSHAGDDRPGFQEAATHRVMMEVRLV